MARPKVLVVDDEYSFAEFARLLLTAIGCDALICLESPMAPEIALRERPDLLMVDLQMPLMDGVELIHKIKARPELKDVPVILCTMSQDRGQISQAFSGGAVYCVTKPLRRDDLKSKISSILGVRL